MLQAASADRKTATGRSNSQPRSAPLAPLGPAIGNQAALRLMRKCGCGMDEGQQTKEQNNPGTALHRKSSAPGPLLPSTLLDAKTQSFFETRLQRKAPGPATASAVSQLQIGAVDDPLEHEADAVADRVLRMPDPTPESDAAVQTVPGKHAGHGIQQQVGNGPAGVLRRVPGWNYTPADYAQLQAGAKTLTMGADSSWFPAQLQQNLIKTLGYFLGAPQAGQPVPTEGVNAMDLFHAHLVVKKTPAVAAQVKAAYAQSDKFDAQLKDARTQSLGNLRYDSPKPPTTKQIGDYKQATDKLLPSFTAMLNQIMVIPGAAVMYHSFENNNPSDLKAQGKVLGDDDPRRQCVTPLDTNTPMQYTPPKGATYEAEYHSITKFTFLVDATSVVHVRPFNTSGGFTTLDLSAMTGTPYKDNLPNERP